MVDIAMFKFEKVEVWKKSVVLYEKVSKISNYIDWREQFSLGEQTRRVALSIPTNIAERTGREGVKESN